MYFLNISPSGIAHPGLLIAALSYFLILSGAVICMDCCWRRIPNGICLAIALGALPYWIAMASWSGLGAMAVQIVLAAVLVVPLLALFAFRLIGGGDVKLILAVVLWVQLDHVPRLIFAIAIIGGLIGLSLKLLNLVFWRVKADSVPYGVAIVTGGMVTIGPAVWPFIARMCGDLA